MDLSRLSAEGSEVSNLSPALDAIGDSAGETWLHLLGLCLDLEAPAGFDRLIPLVEEMRPTQFREVLLGLTAWSWRSIVGGDTIAAAARGQEAAAARLLTDDRYYGRAAAQALSTVLPLDGEETHKRFLTAMKAYHASIDLDALTGPLQEAAREIGALAEEKGPVDAIEDVAGYRYLPEPEARRVALMPHLVGGGLTLTQHEETRLIVYGVTPHPEEQDRLVGLGKALSDPSRVQILSALADGDLPLGELVEITELNRSTVHHHLKQLRAAGLVTVEGNARSYRYQISSRGRARALQDLGRLLGEEEGTS